MNTNSFYLKLQPVCSAFNETEGESY